jgi:hypothetical protein
MCVADAGCGVSSACIAGRCLTRGATPAIATAVRKVYDPVDVAYLRPGEEVRGAGLATLGRGDGALALFRYAVSLPPEATVLEAYLVMDRARDVDSDPTPVTLHAVRIVGDWVAGTTSWARQPALQEVGASETRVGATSPPFVRLEVRALVERWRRHEKSDMGLAIVAEGQSATGLAFVLPARLELYVK